MSRKRIVLLFIIVMVLIFLIIIQIPTVHSRLAWRSEIVTTYLYGLIHPAGLVPTVGYTPNSSGSTQIPVSPVQTSISINSTISPTPSPVPIPAHASLPAPKFEQQDMNNCGPATLTMALRYYGWEGDQHDISGIIKPIPQDRNVNPEEMVYYVSNYAGWLRADYRVGGNLTLLKRLIASGFPVIIEETFIFDSPYWPNDDLWAAHYMFLTGYDDVTRTFTGQDSFHGPDQQIPYDDINKNWEPFNYVFMLVYLPDQETQLRMLIGADWDTDLNRQNTLAGAQNVTIAYPDDAFAWFNLGTNLVYFERYTEAARAYDNARNLGLPQRMMRYQFGPFIAYFHSNRMDDLLTLTNYALERTPTSEEALLWHGWALYRKGDTSGAINDWRKALHEHPGYQDALYALEFVR
jgi:uncharacterized protein YvpB